MLQRLNMKVEVFCASHRNKRNQHESNDEGVLTQFKLLMLELFLLQDCAAVILYTAENATQVALQVKLKTPET
jgi:hypothetical protein